MTDGIDSPPRAELDSLICRDAERGLAFPISRKGARDRLPGPGERSADRGDVLIQLVRSRIGAPPNAKEALDSLDLHRIGHVRVIDGGPTTQGVIRTVDPWIRTFPLTIVAAEVLRGLGSSEAVALFSQRAAKPFAPQRYEDEEVSGWTMNWSVRSSRDYFKLQRQEDALAVGWTTALPLASLVELLETSLVDPVPLHKSEVAVSDSSAKNWRRGEAAHLAEELRWGWRPYEMALFFGPGVLLQWRIPAFPHHVDERVLSGDLHIRFARPSLPRASLLRSLITLTATPRVGRELSAGGAFDQLTSELTALGRTDTADRQLDQ